jgi:signal transduction histidine kinase
LVFGLAALLLVGLAGGLLVRERHAFELGLRADLGARARSFAAELAQRAGVLVARASGEDADARRGVDGVFSEPAEALALERLELAPLEDLEGVFYLDLAAEAEQQADGLERAREYYRAAGSADNSLVCRLIALHRLGALERRAGRVEQARRVNRELVALLDPGTAGKLESLLARVLARRDGIASDGGEPPDPELARDLARYLGGTDDGTLEGLMGELGEDGARALELRRLDLARIERLRQVAPPEDRERGAQVQGEHLIAWVRDGQGALGFAEAPMPGAPAGTETLRADELEGVAGELVEVVPLGVLLPGQVCVARLDGPELARRRFRHLALFALVLVSLLAAGLAALFTTARAGRRERELAEERAAFVQRLGHDLRTPLAVMRLYAETLAEGRAKSPEQARAFAATIVAEAETLSELAQAALDLERLDAGGVQAAKLDLVAVAREVAEVQRPLMEQAGLELVLELPDHSVLVRADAAALRGAIANLVSNARLHGAGEVRVVLSAEKATARLAVLDRGPGLPAEGREGLFERFARGPETSTRGVGLGLALAREVAEAAGGVLRGLDREGGGCEMALELPMVEPT